ncbi:MAG: acyl-CoA reductase [Steroidobacteraceae bacterium]|jgi:hypothetical protein
MAEYDIPLIVRGEIIRDHMVPFSGRRGGISFRTPDVKRYINRVVIGNPAEMADLYRLSLSDVLDYLEELGSRVLLAKNEHLQQAMEMYLAVNVQSKEILAQIYNSLGVAFHRPSIQEAVDKIMGVECLDGWESRRLSDREVKVRAFGARTVHLNPGNSPVAAAYSLMHGSILRCDNIVKFPSNDPYTATALALTMIEMAPDHPVTKHYSVGYWKGGDQAVEEILYTPRNIEKILAWGGPSSMRQVRKYLVPGLDLIALDPKVSGSMIGPEAFLSQETLEYVANQIAKDVGLLNQAACLNARVVYVECGTDASGLQKINRLGELVHAAVQSLPSNLSSCSPEFPAKLREDIDGLRQSSSFRVIGVEHSEGGVIVSQQSEPVHFKDELNGRVVNLVPVDKIEQALKWVTIDTQTIGVYPESLKDQIRDRCALQGVQRLTTLGCATSEAGGYPHDGIELFRRMVRWVVIENFERKVFDHGASVMRAQ